MKIDWVAVYGFVKSPIGAIGFIGSDAVAVAAFFDDRDGNKDGRVSMAERIASMALFNLEGRAVVEVLMQARVDPDIIGRDPSVQTMASKMYLNFARGLIAQGIYTAYFAPGVRMFGAKAAEIITTSTVKQFVIRKGFEKVVKEAFAAGLR
ncbi:hypothetical protein OVA24_10680 [Luteolibacter sp. SL250]|uniref:hypothetical protein n=1 Tax=Luteolibacter sp. SL250 TaxID=2995170 RepID=UPI00226F5000|nr:hypothetical protein [Luteolibacter sp. SL250]WAC21848.1 hypothetical protein OVA24_10680 [Luteolibacter sp. SL250]